MPADGADEGATIFTLIAIAGGRYCLDLRGLTLPRPRMIYRRYSYRPYSFIEPGRSAIIFGGAMRAVLYSPQEPSYRLPDSPSTFSSRFSRAPSFISANIYSVWGDGPPSKRITIAII